jgi:hypothetical protein
LDADMPLFAEVGLASYRCFPVKELLRSKSVNGMSSDFKERKEKESFFFLCGLGNEYWVSAGAYSMV